MTQMTDQHEMLVSMADLSDFLAENISMLQALSTVTHADLTPSMWEKFQPAAQELALLLEAFSESVKFGAKVVGDDAAFAHVTTVMLAD